MTDLLRDQLQPSLGAAVGSPPIAPASTSSSTTARATSGLPSCHGCAETRRVYRAVGLLFSAAIRSSPAVVALAAGDREPLLQLLAPPAGRRRWNNVFLTLGCIPILDPIMNDARYIAIIEELGVRRCQGNTPWPIRPRRGGAQ